MNAAVRAVRHRHPTFKQALLADLRAFLAYRMEANRRLVSRGDAVRELLRMLWVSDAFFALACYRGKARLQALGVPVLPFLLHRLAMSSAQVCIGDPVVVEPGVYIAHGQVVIDGFATIGSGSVLLPWVTIGLAKGELRGPTIGAGVSVGTGAKLLGPIHIGAGAQIGANAVVLADVPEGATAVGVPARVIEREDPLGTAEQLVADGDLRGAIDLLTARNRVAPSVDVERRLVQLRHECFLAENHPPPSATWPPADPGLFAGCDSIPEVDASELEVDAIRSGILGHGSLIVRNLLDPSQVERLATSVQAAFDEFDARAAGRTPDPLDPWFHPFASAPGLEQIGDDERQWVRDGGGVMAVDSPRGLFELIEVMTQTSLLDTLTEHLGERPALSVRKTTLRLIAPEAAGGWHQDGAFLGDALRTVNVWISLSHCGLDAPSIDVVPRRVDHIVPTGTDGAAFSWSVSDAMAEEVAAPKGTVRPVFAPGDAILFDEFNLHRTGQAPGLTKPRLAIEAWCFAPSTYPMAQLPIAI